MGKIDESNNETKQIRIVLGLENASLEQTMNNTTEKPESSSNVSARCGCTGNAESIRSICRASGSRAGCN